MRSGACRIDGPNCAALNTCPRYCARTKKRSVKFTFRAAAVYERRFGHKIGGVIRAIEDQRSHAGQGERRDALRREADHVCRAHFMHVRLGRRERGTQLDLLRGPRVSIVSFDAVIPAEEIAIRA